MSLYALPGLFPPLASFKDPSCPRGAAKAAASLSLDAFSALGKDGQRDEMCLGAYDAIGEEMKSEAPDHGPIHAGPRPVPSSVAVAVVREARIDTARLIQSLTSAAGSRAGQAPGRQPSRADGKRRRAGRPSGLARLSDASQGGGRRSEPPAPAVTPQEECMEFELTIHYGDGSGRSWSATRRLECFLELQRALVRQEGSPLDEDDDRGVGERGAGFPSSARKRPCRIPPVPRVHHGEAVGGGPSEGGGACGGVGGAAGKGGFLFLQALVRCYVPRLEEWLRGVLRQLRVANPERCPALSNFLFRDDGEPPCPLAMPLLWPSSAPAAASRPAGGPSVTSPPLSQSSPSVFRPLDSIEESDELEC